MNVNMWEVNHAEFLGIFVIYLHTDSHPLYLVLLSVQQWSIEFIDVDIPNMWAVQKYRTFGQQKYNYLFWHLKP